MKANWVDLQINGYGGIDFNASGLTVEKVKAVTRRLAADGTAVYLPTFVTGDPGMVLANIRIVAEARRTDAECRDRIAGVHLEGPFLSPKKSGAQSPENILIPNEESVETAKQRIKEILS